MNGRFGWAAALFAAVQTTAPALTTHPASAQQNTEVDPAQIDQGKVTFAQKCSHCHGPNMVNAGTIAPDLRKFPDDRERFFTTVQSANNNKFPAWRDLLIAHNSASLC